MLLSRAQWRAVRKDRGNVARAAPFPKIPRRSFFRGEYMRRLVLVIVAVASIRMPTTPALCGFRRSVTGIDAADPLNAPPRATALPAHGARPSRDAAA
jgi:hypothetical protein